MAEYKAIKGQTIQNRTSDPKAAGIAGATWTSGGDLNRGLSVGMAGAGASNSAAIVTGGQTGGPPYVIQDKTEEYNGTAWSEEADLNAARNSLAGTSSAPYASALVHGGGGTGDDTVESWNGSAWSETT